jgi:hypothetical protein
MTRGPRVQVKNRLREAIYSVDRDVSRLALFFLKHIEHREFGLQAVARLRNGQLSDARFMLMIGTIASLRCSEDIEVRRQLDDLLARQTPVGARMRWFVNVIRIDIAREVSSDEKLAHQSDPIAWRA